MPRANSLVIGFEDSMWELVLKVTWEEGFAGNSKKCESVHWSQKLQHNPEPELLYHWRLHSFEYHTTDFLKQSFITFLTCLDKKKESSGGLHAIKKLIRSMVIASYSIGKLLIRPHWVVGPLTWSDKAPSYICQAYLSVSMIDIWKKLKYSQRKPLIWF